MVVKIGATPNEISVGVPQKPGNIFIIQSSYTTLKYIPHELCIVLQRYLLFHVIVALFAKARQWKQLKWPSNDEWIMKM